MDNITETFCMIDDFCREFEPEFEKQMLVNNPNKRRRKSALSLSELMTIVVLFHQFRSRQLKAFYLFHVCLYMHREFPNLPSYQRFIELLPRCAVPFTALFQMLKGECDGISIVDSTPIAVCDNRRIRRHRTFKGKAALGKNSMGWFYGFKLHLIINSQGELLSIKLTPGNTDDRKPVPNMCEGLVGQIFGDRGYISKALAEKLLKQGLELITTLRKNMKPVLRTDFEKSMLHQRSLIETVIDQLKNLCQIEHTRHRSVTNFGINLMAGIVAYCLADNKPSFNLIRSFDTMVMA